MSFLLLGGGLLLAQSVAINAIGAAPNASALLDIDAAPGNNKGLLIPRISLTSTTDVVTIANPATSLLVYNTNAAMILGGVGYWYWDGTKWVALLNNSSTNNQSAWLLTGNAGTTAGTNFIGTTDIQDLVFKTNNTEWMRILSGGNVGIGTSGTYGKVHIIGDGQALNLQTSNVNNTFDIQFYDANDISGSYKWDLTYRGNASGDDLFLMRNAGTPVMSWMNSSGNVGIGTNAPTAKLELQGQIKIVDGTEGAGKMLTSDAAGLASWNISPSDVADFSTNVLASGTASSFTSNNYTLTKGVYFVSFYNCVIAASASYYIVATAQTVSGTASSGNFVWDFLENKYYTSTPFIVKVQSATAVVNFIVYHAQGGTITNNSPTCSQFIVSKISN